jgi:RNAse (barnase) inhibitor barstar
MKEILIDGNKFSDLSGFYDEIERIFTKGLNWKIGRNLDALNDLLRGGFGMHEYEQPIVVRWINSTKSQSDFGYKATLEYLKSVLEKCHRSNRKSVKNRIELAKNEKGETLFQTISGIIEDHHHIEFWKE